MVLHSEPEAARILKLAPRSLQRYRQSGIGPKFVRIGQRRIGYTDEAIAAWLEQRTFASIAAEYAAASKAADSGDAAAHE
jgi:predicted DNA-binding transcriptional regulator AlpA